MSRKQRRKRERRPDGESKPMMSFRVLPLTKQLIAKVAQGTECSRGQAVDRFVFNTAMNEPVLRDFINQVLADAIQAEVALNGVHPNATRVALQRVLGTVMADTLVDDMVQNFPPVDIIGAKDGSGSDDE